MKHWVKEGKSADDIFQLLKLNQADDKVYKNLMWSTWISYLKRLNHENPDEPMYVTMKTHFGVDGVAKMIGMAARGARTKDLSRALEEELWRSQGKTGDGIFKMLRLDEESGNMFLNPEFSVWISYVTKVNKPETKKRTFSSH